MKKKVFISNLNYRATGIISFWCRSWWDNEGWRTAGSAVHKPGRPGWGCNAQCSPGCSDHRQRWVRAWGAWGRAAERRSWTSGDLTSPYRGEGASRRDPVGNRETSLAQGSPGWAPGQNKRVQGGRSRQGPASKNLETLPRHTGSVRKVLYGTTTTWNHQ